MRRKLLLFIIIAVLVSSCSDFSVQSKLVNGLTLSDSNPPVLLEVISESDRVVRLVFNEEIRPFGSSFGPFNIEKDGNSLLITLDNSLKPGQQTYVSARVEDSAGNTTEVNVSVWGFNENPAEIIINEFTTRGSDSSPDRVEFLVLSSGSLAGFTIYAGSPQDYDSSFIFPDFDVQAGDYVVLYWASQYPSGSSVPQYSFLSGFSENPTSNNGVLVLTDSPAQGSRILDAVLYSSFESTKYEGWGTRSAFERAKWVSDRNCWEGDAVNCSSSTATRSICRINREDTDSSSDWYVTVTSGATFGTPNTSPAYR